ncbi:hypothetical protein CEXT_522681 [Caerostris extrusa]|uniref:Uncharacterized protein n=1 Tax=Caerostris extrusa TaxID=172846 RepID=A0AAV4MPL3_CAEEX|nr:hypothetical protein CEXT_522681 [Caerostris extrusa]
MIQYHNTILHGSQKILFYIGWDTNYTKQKNTRISKDNCKKTSSYWRSTINKLAEHIHLIRRNDTSLVLAASENGRPHKFECATDCSVSVSINNPFPVEEIPTNRKEQ